MKKLLKTSCAILMAMILSTGMLAIPVKAAEAASVNISSTTATVGDSVSVTVNVSSSSEIIMCDLWVTYDANILEAVSGFSSGGGGTVRILNTDNTSFTLKFKALTSGSSNIGISSSSIITSMTADRLTINANTGKETVNAPAANTPGANTPGANTPGGVTNSSNNNLSSLAISPGTLSPAFSPNVTSYTATVGSDCASLIVSAPAEDSTAKVSVSGKTMDTGTNTTKIIVTAQNGATKTYVITTTKEAGVTESTEAQTIPVVATTTTTLNGASYNVISDFTNHALPTGYTATTFDFDGQSVTVGKGTNGLTIMYLEKADGSGTGNFYVYDTVSKTFSLLSTVTQPVLTYTILPITSNMEIPDTYTKSILTINGNDVDVLIPSGTDVKYCLFYGVDSAGTAGWYRFDYAEQTVQKYYGDDLSSAVVDSSNVAAQGGNVKLWKIIAAGAGVASIIFLIMMIVLVFKLKSKESDEDEDEDDDSDDGEDIFSTIAYNELHNNDNELNKDNSDDENLDDQNGNKEDHNSEIASEIGADAAATLDIEEDDFRLDTEGLFDDDDDQDNDVSDMKDILADDDIKSSDDEDDDDFEFLDIDDIEDK